MIIRGLAVGMLLWGKETHTTGLFVWLLAPLRHLELQGVALLELDIELVVASMLEDLELLHQVKVHPVAKSEPGVLLVLNHRLLKPDN